MKRTNGMAKEIETALKNVPGIQYAFMHDSSIGNPEDREREVDIIILGGPDLVIMDEVISKAEGKLRTPFLITSYTVREFRERIRAKDEAILRILQGPKIMLLGDEEGLRRL